MGCCVLGFEEIDRTQVAVVGAKGAHLGELSRIEGIRVPAGFCVTTEAFRRMMAEAPPIDVVLPAFVQFADGAVLVDIRPQAQRRQEGEIPGALVIERNVLEWRLDPTSPHRVRHATDHDVQVIVFCSEGYTSSLAAASLLELGLARATDMAGGYHAWLRAGLPTTPGGRDPDA